MPKPQRVIEIEDLPGPARTALAYAITRKDRPPALASRSPDLYGLWFVLGGLILVYALFAGYGEPNTAAQEPAEMVFYAFGFSAVALGVLGSRAKSALAARLRFPPGVYVVGSRLVDARAPKLGLYQLLADRPAVVHHHVNGSYKHTRVSWHGFGFTFNRQAVAAAALERVRADLELLGRAFDDGDRDRLLTFDPIATGLQLADGDPPQTLQRFDRPRAASPSRTAIAIAAIATAGLTVGGWFLRNHLSLEAAYDAIGSVDDAQEWVRHGGDAARGRNREAEVAIDDATRYGVRADRLRAVLAEYADVPAATRKPAEVALAARYAEARQAALALAGTNAQLAWFVDQTYDRLAAGGSAIMQVAVARTDNTSLEELDAVIRADRDLREHVVAVGGFFGGDNEQQRVDALQGAVQGGMGQFFPDDVMTYGAAAADSSTIEIFYVIRIKRDAEGTPVLYSYVDDRGKPVPDSMSYPAVEFELGATLKVSGGPAPQRVVFVASPSPTISVATSGASARSAEDDAAVYRAMSDSAFSDLQLKLVHALGGTLPEEQDE